MGEGDPVVHAEHGIGRFEGLVTLEIGGAPHDCLKLVYHGGDKLFVPVENLDVLSRYGHADQEVVLDRLGGVGWQTRKAKVKERIRELAGELIKIAAERLLRKGTVLDLPPGVYEEFAARFPYEETEDQLAAIEAVLEDMGSGRPMDRLICGDVGFGKTEVALRAAFVAALSGKQVALLAPTTLLVRQHFRLFASRFEGLPVRVAQLSRFVTTKEANEVKKGLADGQIDIVVGTHALLGKGVQFKNLGLVIVDEEQHFGVAHKEKLKQLRAEVHVLTMTATPIPRTLHMALGGMKDLSIIATPPVDRLTVRTFIMPSDPVVLREAIMREYWRGGQCFYVCPRISDQAKLKDDLTKLVPELKLAIANGQMPAMELDRVMGEFYDRKLDLLIATNIIESGLDIPTANTLIVHRADLFGLAQLYQLRGRVGRSKVRGYAYFTVPANKTMADTAERRLSVIQSLEGLGAGFQLASHDLDIRGAGNLLGDEQSGQIREVGFELYNHMLEEAVAELRANQAGAAAEAAPSEWTPQITIDAAALMPESFIGDLDLRLPCTAASPAHDTRGAGIVRGRADRPLRQAAAGDRAAAAAGGDQAALPPGQRRQARRRPQGHRPGLPREHLRPAGAAGPADRRQPRPDEGPPGPQGRAAARDRQPDRAAEGGAQAQGQAGAAGQPSHRPPASGRHGRSAGSDTPAREVPCAPPPAPTSWSTCPSCASACRAKRPAGPTGWSWPKPCRPRTARRRFGSTRISWRTRPWCWADMPAPPARSARPTPARFCH